LLPYTTMRKYKELKREVEREVRHIFNLVRQFAYVHKSAVIFNNMNQSYNITYL
jgi:hypothetical protein